VLTWRVLNRTLLARQHLLARSTHDPLTMVDHLVGLQAQDNLPPYLSLAARLEDFAPKALSATLEERTTVRLLLMRGTIHLVTNEDATVLRAMVQESLVRQMKATAFARHCADLDPATLAATVTEILTDRPLAVRPLGARLAGKFADHDPGHLANTARVLVALPQVPPRGLWRRSGGPAYALLEQWTGRSPPERTDVAGAARRFLAAYGPASVADIQTWSGLTGLRAVVDGMHDLVRLRDEAGKELLDLPGQRLASGDEPAPVRLLGKYDNVWLSHAARDRVTPDHAKRERWMGRNGGVGNVMLVDGVLDGLWRSGADGRVDVEPFRRLSRAEREELETEVGRVEALLATPAHNDSSA
jgi:hypothetical protein